MSLVAQGVWRIPHLLLCQNWYQNHWGILRLQGDPKPYLWRVCCSTSILACPSPLSCP
jgi:hypothetical protein